VALFNTVLHDYPPEDLFLDGWKLKIPKPNLDAPK